MNIHKNFVGGNISVKKIDGNNVYLENELRDTTEDWFYWAFCIEDACERTLTFHFQPIRLGNFGPAVSYDLKHWHWLDKKDGDSFTYTFSKTETKVYFAYSFLYHPEMFYEFAEKNSLEIEEFCKSEKGRSVPCVRFGNGSKSIILTARHHACESGGNYVLEGVTEQLHNEPMPDQKVLCVPFVDFDGVIDGDQGKSRYPHDHNRDYAVGEKPIYSSTAAIIDYADKNGCVYAFDFHCPWYCGGLNDNIFIVQNSLEKLETEKKFGRYFEECISDGAMKYYQKNDYPPFFKWNQPGAQFACYMLKRPENLLAFSLETAYFGSFDNKASQENLKETGRCFAKALLKFSKDNN